MIINAAVSEHELGTFSIKIDKIRKFAEQIRTWAMSAFFVISLEMVLNIDEEYIMGQHRVEVLWRTLIEDI